MDASLYISHETALDYWRLLARDSTPFPSVTQVKEVSPAPVRSADVQNLKKQLALSGLPAGGPHHLLAADAAARRRIAGTAWHIWKHPVPSSAFVQIGDGTFVATPEFLFLQMAAHLPYAQLLQLGFELCGFYVFDPLNRQNFATTQKSLSSPEALSRFLEACPPCHGTKRARRALRWVLPRAFSPMEADIAILMTLPVKVGGLQLPKPILNEKIFLPPDLAQRAGAHHYMADFYWPDHHLAVEYDSRQEHSDRRRSTLDKKRVEILQQVGVTVKSITEFQVFRISEFDTLAKGICETMRRTYYPLDPKRRERQMNLRVQLFARMGNNLLIG